VKKGGSAQQVATRRDPKEVLSSALLESAHEILTHYGQTPRLVPEPLSVPADASIGASMQFGNKHLRVGVILLATQSFLHATLPYPPNDAKVKVELRNWALELCNQLTGLLRGRLQCYGINATPGLPHTAYNYNTRRLERTEDSTFAFDSDAGLIYIKLSSWIDPELSVPMRPSSAPSLSPGELRLF
jgi:hypothetical protein